MAAQQRRPMIFAIVGVTLVLGMTTPPVGAAYTFTEVAAACDRVRSDLAVANSPEDYGTSSFATPGDYYDCIVGSMVVKYGSTESGIECHYVDGTDLVPVVCIDVTVTGYGRSDDTTNCDAFNDPPSPDSICQEFWVDIAVSGLPTSSGWGEASPHGGRHRWRSEGGCMWESVGDLLAPGCTNIRIGNMWMDIDPDPNCAGSSAQGHTKIQGVPFDTRTLWLYVDCDPENWNPS